jgi:thiamine-phosphate pyrophosphorylase
MATRRLPVPPILVITDRKRCPEPLEARALALFRGGCQWLSLREKDLAPDARSALLALLIGVARPFGATISVHADIDAAAALGAALHLPANGEAVQARHRLGPHAFIGQSCHNEDEISAAAAAGADYVTMSPIFETASKPGYAPAQDIVAAISASRVPVLGLGGITADTLQKLPPAFNGIAVMGAAMTAADPQDWFADIEARWRDLNTGRDQPAGFT